MAWRRASVSPIHDRDGKPAAEMKIGVGEGARQPGRPLFGPQLCRLAAVRTFEGAQFSAGMIRDWRATHQRRLAAARWARDRRDVGRWRWDVALLLHDVRSLTVTGGSATGLSAADALKVCSRRYVQTAPMCAASRVSKDIPSQIRRPIFQCRPLQVETGQYPRCWRNETGRLALHPEQRRIEPHR